MSKVEIFTIFNIFIFKTYFQPEFIIWLLKAEFITEFNKPARPSGANRPLAGGLQNLRDLLGVAGLFNSVINSAFNNQIMFLLREK